jgi:uncharacterized protein (TIGR02646 family)
LRFVQIPLPPPLPRRWPAIYSARIAGLGACPTQASRSTYIKANASWTRLKNWLASVSAGKCWYCEVKSTRAPCDVDHFRPKLGITVDGVLLLAHTGYYWLAYEWCNFRLACQRCNRPEKDDLAVLHGKANEFPIRDEAQRCAVPTAPLGNEMPKILDPCVEADCQLLAHGIDGEVKPVAPAGTWDYERARYTIEKLGFNDWNSPETKKNSWRPLDDLIRLAGNHPAVVAHLKERLDPAHEYSMFFRAVIGAHRDKGWVEGLL